MKTIIIFLVGVAVGVYVTDNNPEMAGHVRSATSEAIDSAEKLLK